jgi:hypothetical protein
MGVLVVLSTFVICAEEGELSTKSATIPRASRVIKRIERIGPPVFATEALGLGDRAWAEIQLLGSASYWKRAAIRKIVKRSSATVRPVNYSGGTCFKRYAKRSQEKKSLQTLRTTEDASPEIRGPSAKAIFHRSACPQLRTVSESP